MANPPRFIAITVAEKSEKATKDTRPTTDFSALLLKNRAHHL